MARPIKYKLSCNPDVLYSNKGRALAAADTICRSRPEPVVLIGIGASGSVCRWEVISTQKLYDLNQRHGALVCLIDPPPEGW